MTTHEGPVDAARRWLDAIRLKGIEEAIEAVWPLTDPEYRAALVGMLRVDARYRPLLAEIPWRSKAWPTIYAERIRLALLDAVGDAFEPTWVADADLHPVAPDVEDVLFGPAGGELAGLGLRMHATSDTWLVVGVQHW